MKTFLFAFVLVAALLFVRGDDDDFDDDDDWDDRCYTDFNCDLDECCVPHRRFQGIRVCVDRGEKIGSYCGGQHGCECLRGLICVPFNETNFGIFSHPYFYGTCQLPAGHPAAVDQPALQYQMVPIQRTAPLPPYIYRHSFEIDDDFDDLFDD